MKKKILISALLSVAVIAIVTVLLLLLFKEDTVLAPDYAPPGVDENAEKIEGDSGEKMDVPQGGGGITITYKQKAVIDLSDEMVALSYDNPGRSHNDVVLQVIVRGEVVAQSGTIKPGYCLRTLPLLEGAAKKLQAGVYETDTKLMLLTYDPDSGEKTMMQYDLDLTVLVQE